MELIHDTIYFTEYCSITHNRSTVRNWSLPNTALETQQCSIFETPSGPCPEKSLVDWWSTCLLDLFLHHKSSNCSLDFPTEFPSFPQENWNPTTGEPHGLSNYSMQYPMGTWELGSKVVAEKKVCQIISVLSSADSAEPTSFRLRTVCFSSKTCPQTEPLRTKPLVDWLLAKRQSRARCIPCLSLKNLCPWPGS